MASTPTRWSVNPLRVTHCESQKMGYDSYDEALTAAERMMELGHVNPGCHITPYECDRCSSWHVGNRVIVPIGRPHRGNR